MTGRAGAVLDATLARRQSFVELVGELVRRESPSQAPELFPPLLEVVSARLEPLGYRGRLLPGRRTGGAWVARLRRRGPFQLLVGHLDTVWPVGTLATMPLEVEGELLRGPGALDMKGGVAQLVVALEVLAELGLAPSLAPVVFLNMDEEIGSRESTGWLRRLAARCRRAFVLEPALGPEGRLKTRRKGVGGFSVVAHGRAAHAGLAPEEGASAILELALVIQQLFALNDPAQGVSVNVGTVEGGLRGNVVAPMSRAAVDVRAPTQESAQRLSRVICGLQASTPGVRLEVSGGFGRPPLEPTPRNQALWERARQLGAELGLELEQGLAGGGSDGSTTSQLIATLDGLGAVGDGAHASHEHIRIDESLRRAALLALLLLEEEPCPESWHPSPA